MKEIVVSYEKQRRDFLNKLISNVGEIVEEKHRIVCTIRQDLLEKKPSDFYILNLMGVRAYFGLVTDVINYYGLDKPVDYIFDGITFDKPIKLYASYCNIEFVNCTFINSAINVYTADMITLENNTYINCDPIFLSTKSIVDINQLNIINENLIDKCNADETSLGIDVITKQTNIINTDVDANCISIKAKNLYIYDTTAKACNVYLDAEKITIEQSLLAAQEKMVIVNPEYASLVKTDNGITSIMGNEQEHSKSFTITKKN